MGKRGPRPEPTQLKILKGNPGRRPLNTREPQAPAGEPSCPKHLTREAKAEWKRICGELAALGLLSIVDRAALACYCQSWARHVAAEKERDQRGDYIETANGWRLAPWVRVSQDERKIMRSYLQEFGLSPSSRSRLEVDEFAAAKAKQTEDDEFDRTKRQFGGSA